jgi:hypothetical protein
VPEYRAQALLQSVPPAVSEKEKLMSRTAIRFVSGCASALFLLGATAMSANASYLGYGNGDPGNWDFWTEQNGGPVKKAVALPAPLPAKHAHAQPEKQHTG